MPIIAKFNSWRRWALALTVPTSLALFQLARSELRGFNACQILRTRIDSATVQHYSETPDDLNLFAPVAVALARNKITKLVEQRSQFDCAVTSFRLWRSSTGSNEVNGESFRP
jgi:hypothetical protein